ncbi:MAG TPA: hypothetical protein PKI02_08540, partial [Mycobacterium sp.]|nr:hypothetical protein [Mycobacterium sp.]
GAEAEAAGGPPAEALLPAIVGAVVPLVSVAAAVIGAVVGALLPVVAAVLGALVGAVRSVVSVGAADDPGAQLPEPGHRVRWVGRRVRPGRVQLERLGKLRWIQRLRWIE